MINDYSSIKVDENVELLNQSTSYQSISALNPQEKHAQNHHKMNYLTNENVRKSKTVLILLIYIHAYIINEEQIDGMLLNKFAQEEV